MDNVVYGISNSDIDIKETLNDYLSKAILQINKYCNFYFDDNKLEDLPLESDKTNVIRAIQVQARYLDDLTSELGNRGELTGNNQVTSIHIGNTSKTYSNLDLNKKNIFISPEAIDYLAPTGLLYRGVGQYR